MKGSPAHAASALLRIAAPSLRMSGFRAQIGGSRLPRDPTHPLQPGRGRLPQGAAEPARWLHRVGGHVALKALERGFAGINSTDIDSRPGSGGDRPAAPTRAEARKRQKSLDFEGSIRQNYELSGFSLPPRHIRSKNTVRPNLSPIPACCAHQPTARPLRQVSLGVQRGGSAEISKKTLETGSRRAVSDTKVRSHTDGSRNS